MGLGLAGFGLRRLRTFSVNPRLIDIKLFWCYQAVAPFLNDGNTRIALLERKRAILSSDMNWAPMAWQIDQVRELGAAHAAVQETPMMPRATSHSLMLARLLESTAAYLPCFISGCAYAI